MDAPVETVPLSRIDWQDERFAIRSHVPWHALRNSLARHGVLTPPWVWGGTEKMVVVDGFKRLRWSREMGRNSLPCSVFPMETPYETLVELRVMNKLHGPPLNAAEKSRIAGILATGLPQGPVRKAVLAELKIPDRPEALKRWARLAEVEGPFLEAAASGTVHERVAVALADRDEEERRAFLDTFMTLRCSASVQMEILDHVSEIALARNESPLAVLRHSDFLAVVHHERRDAREKTGALRELLRGWRYPRLSAREDRFRRSLEVAGLPGKISLDHPPAFEGSSWQLRIRFDSPSELKELLETALVFARSKGLPAAMEAA